MREPSLSISRPETGANSNRLMAKMEITAPAAAMPMLHETVVNDDVASMPHVMAIPVPPGSTVELAPGGFHAMLMDLAAALEEGATFPVTLTFEQAGEVVIEAEVPDGASMEVVETVYSPALADGSNGVPAKSGKLSGAVITVFPGPTVTNAPPR